MATYRKNGGGSTDLPLEDGTHIAVLGPVDESRYDREQVGLMLRVVAFDGNYAGQYFELFADEIEPEV